MSLVSLDVDGAVATLTLNDPARRNCASEQLNADLVTACAAINDNPDIAVAIVTGAGPIFSAGGDVDSLDSPDHSNLPELYRGTEAIWSLVMPTIAAVQGPAIGVGTNFALACDVIVAAESASFTDGFLDIAIHPGGGHVWRLNGLVGRQTTAAMVLFGEVLTAQQAADAGLVWKAVPDADLMTEVRRLADVVARRPTNLLRRTKATLRTSIPLHDERLATDLERVAQEWSMAQPAFVESARRLRERVQKNA